MGLEKKYFAIDKVEADPFKEFDHWFKLAQAQGNFETDVMSLATATPQGKPSVRMVLFKGIQDGGFLFYSNYESQKGLELAANPQAAVAFYWPLIYRQVRFEGKVSRLSAADSDEYFHSRARGSQLAAATSRQSQSVSSIETLHQNYDAKVKEFEGKDIPRPEYWGGYKIIPSHFEFWLGQDHRLHHRFNYVLKNEKWEQGILSP